MRFLIFSEYYYPERFLITEIAEKLVESGNQVTVITGKPNYNYPNGLVPVEYIKIDSEQINGVDIIRCNVPGRGNNKIRLLYNYFVYAKNASKIAKKFMSSDFDIVLCYQLTPVIQLIPAIRYAKKNNKRLLCYCLDLAPFSGEKLLSHFPLIKKIYAKMARKYYKACDLIAVTSESFIPYMQNVNGIETEKLVYLPQHASEELLQADLSKQPNGQIVFMFAGNIGGGAKIETVINAVDILMRKGVGGFVVHLVGDGSAKNDLIRKVHEKHLSELIVFRDAVSMKDMAGVYADADALLITLRKGQITIPGKLQAYMSTGKCILGAMDGSGRDIIEEAECGLCVPGEDALGLARIMEQYLSDYDQYNRLGENGKRYFEKHFTLDTFIKNLKICIEKTIGNISVDNQ